MMRFPDFFFFRLETGYPVGGFRLFCDRGFVAAWQQFLICCKFFSKLFKLVFLFIIGLRAT